ncbi:PD40 domain-containing protein [Kitasatospora kazusensis]|uniref:PD40 domain-containing protein n=1 Tax=Kitasatospora kazusensis TaxID=407974 RepID=A0ABN2ZZM7_9ACTN
MTDTPETPLITRGRLTAFAAAFVLLAALGIGYGVHAAHRQDVLTHQGPGAAPAAQDLDLTGATGEILFRDTEPGPGYGFLATVRRSDPAGPRTVGRTSCERVYAAAGTVVCLSTEYGAIPSHHVRILDSTLGQLREIDLGAGAPNRARISADGRMASWTVFTSGDSYAANTFSTRTSILDVRTGALTPTLEDFDVLKDGKPYRPVDRNFWGVTFASDDNTFYATMSPISTGKTYLVRGDLAQHRLTVLRENVECPSLSPDGTRIAFKKRVSGSTTNPWRLAVLDLADNRETLLAETRSVDDQAAWLDDSTVAYALPAAQRTGSDLWTVPADGTGAPALLLHGGFSPAPLTTGKQ